jgi:uncharacterized protein (TIGR04551 family)
VSARAFASTLVAGLAAASITCIAPAASATGFTDAGQDLHPREKTEFDIHGYFRTRTEVLSNLDLDRGLTPSGAPIYPVPAGGGQNFFYGDMRFRTDVNVYALGGGVAIRGRFDVLDNVAMGGAPQGFPSGSSTQVASSGAFRVKRVWGEAVTPIGVIAAGRMGNAWGLGMLANGGDCPDCDSGDAQDRLAFVTAVGGLIWAAAYDLAWVGPTEWRKDGIRQLGWAPTTDVHTVTFAAMRWNDDPTHDRRRAAGRPTVNYGAYVSHRWQDQDAPYAYLPIAASAVPSANPVTARGFSATAVDGWFRFVAPGMRIEIEAAVLTTRIAQPSLLPGLKSNVDVKGTQIGVALESDFGNPEDAFSAGLDMGYASGNDAPGFGLTSDPTSPVAKKGDLDGLQIDLPYQRNANAFKFHADYRVDRILFREILGTVTGAAYFRPHARLDLYKLHTGTLRAMVAAVGSFADYAINAPGQKRPLGIEIDPTIAYGSRDGFGLALEYAVLFPLSGLDNVTSTVPLHAKPAQLFRLRLMYAF